jgi:hypothetical protein
MFAHGGVTFKGLLTLVCALALIAFSGCGDGSSPTGETTPGDATAEADAGDLEVIEGWSRALSEGDLEGAADYFALPSTAENGPVLVDIETREDAIAFNDSLPCGAEVVSAQTTGDFTAATFRLSDRPGGDCGDGAGGRASTSFEIEDGKIVEWRRIDSPGSAPTDGEGGSTV